MFDAGVLNEQERGNCYPSPALFDEYCFSTRAH
jgi:hypothetical protein